ncbi:GAF domain-containing protein [Novosphingopyxis sp.]|uniref:GAF domain-containing protein n=1 Tax=Novosphingopyxis sp. TaxID=2709690 RepID=UPI003B5CCA39
MGVATSGLAEPVLRGSEKVNETRRLNALYATGLLDSGQEERFDRIARLTANMLDAKLAFVSLIDSDTQHFKARHGTDLTETSRDIAFCDHAIRHPRDLMIVPDARLDDRFADNPLVTGEMGVRFYAGQPLVTKSGYAIGTLCVLDDKPRAGLGERERAILADLAGGVMVEIEQVQEIEDLAVVNAELKHRMGNMYAHIGALVSLIGRDAPDKETLIRKLQEKISSFGVTQQLLADQDWKSVGVTELVEQVLAGYRAERPRHRITVQTDDRIKLSPRGAFIVTLMVGELATNAVKHGALGADSGSVDFSWMTENDMHVFEWRERFERADGPVVEGKGFGTDILKRIVPMDMRGAAEMHIDRAGMYYRVTARPERIAEL